MPPLSDAMAGVALNDPLAQPRQVQSFQTTTRPAR